jgi:hypothetical protein
VPARLVGLSRGERDPPGGAARHRAQRSRSHQRGDRGQFGQRGPRTREIAFGRERPDDQLEARRSIRPVLRWQPPKVSGREIRGGARVAAIERDLR